MHLETLHIVQFTVRFFGTDPIAWTYEGQKTIIGKKERGRCIDI